MSPLHALSPCLARRFVVPAVLLAVCAAGLTGLAPSPGRPTERVAAADATSQLSTTTPESPLGQPDAPDPRPGRATRAAPTVRPAPPARASRSRPAARIAPPAPRYVRPDVGSFTSGFEDRWGSHHDGIDLAGPYASPVLAVTAGQVVFAGQQDGYGNIVLVQHDDATVTAYAHLSAFVVRSGQVRAGEVIAEEGNSGHSTGAHLHFEVRIDGVPVNPVPWLARRGIFV